MTRDAWLSAIIATIILALIIWVGRERRKNEMSCRYACICGGTCWNCSEKEPERYFGEAEDLRAQELGYASYDDHMRHSKRQGSFGCNPNDERGSKL